CARFSSRRGTVATTMSWYLDLW
nr:immunoglobulin heavy chain junction region [Macaca mulatta]MOV43230.1 immunoglobulin heavy chain junction region [Macaca mulatta]